MWKGSMDSGNPSHPRSTSVKVSTVLIFMKLHYICLYCCLDLLTNCDVIHGGLSCMQLLSRQSLEFNPLRLFVVWKGLLKHGVSNTSHLVLRLGLNANVAVHDDKICRPAYDTASGRLLQRCASCTHLGTNVENARMSFALQCRRTEHGSLHPPDAASIT
jgi:hypothetical protein